MLWCFPCSDSFLRCTFALFLTTFIDCLSLYQSFLDWTLFLNCCNLLMRFAAVEFQFTPCYLRVVCFWWNKSYRHSYCQVLNFIDFQMNNSQQKKGFYFLHFGAGFFVIWGAEKSLNLTEIWHQFFSLSFIIVVDLQWVDSGCCCCWRRQNRLMSNFLADNFMFWALSLIALAFVS